jgi:hypothetical protein
MAALDRFERTLSASPRTVMPVRSASTAPPVAVDMPDADIVTLPLTASVSTASGSVSATPSGAGAAKPAAAI